MTFDPSLDGIGFASFARVAGESRESRSDSVEAFFSFLWPVSLKKLNERSESRIETEVLWLAAMVDMVDMVGGLSVGVVVLVVNECLRC